MTPVWKFHPKSNKQVNNVTKKADVYLWQIIEKTGEFIFQLNGNRHEPIEVVKTAICTPEKRMKKPFYNRSYGTGLSWKKCKSSTSE